MDKLGPTARTRVKRLPKRGHYDRVVVNEVLDAGFICHIGYVIDGQPYVTPPLIGAKAPTSTGTALQRAACCGRRRRAFPSA